MWLKFDEAPAYSQLWDMFYTLFLKLNYPFFLICRYGYLWIMFFYVKINSVAVYNITIICNKNHFTLRIYHTCFSKYFSTFK